MTIRKTLLAAFLLVALAPAILLGGLAFVKARGALQDEIERSLAAQAGALSADMDKMLFERLQNAAIWSQLEVMQDLQVQDVDRRLSAFLARLQSGYGGVYRRLDAVDGGGRVMASSDPAALGQQAATPPVWQHATLSGAGVSLALPEMGVGPEDTTLLIRSTIQSHFGDAPLGELRLAFDWGQVEALLDRAAVDGREVAVLDAEGRMVAASQALRERGHLLGRSLAAWAPSPSRPAAHVLDGRPLGLSTVVVGAARAATFAGFEGLGWRTLVIQPLDRALAPIHRMIALSLMLVGALILAILLLATWVSGEIAKPVVALTAFARRYRLERRFDAVPPGGTGEIGELSTAFVEMMRDIDHSQRKLVQASKLAAVGEMASVIAHEVRTPLGILRSSAQMLRREPGLSEEGQELMGFIESETERLNRLVSTMLDSARPRPPAFVPVDVHELARHCMSLLASQAGKKDVRLSEAFAAAEANIEGDREQLTQVLLNLILNAIQILQPGGEVSVASADRGDALEIEIADDGPGIAPEERERIFEAFFFRREGGVGLGLAVVQQIVQAHGGSISAGESALGGARFTILLPRHHSEEHP